MRRCASVAVLVAGMLAAGATPGRGSDFLNAPVSARQVGMGGVAVSGMDVLAAWTNPATVSRQRDSGEVAASGSSMLGGLQQLAAVGGAVRLSQSWVVGVIAWRYSADVNAVDRYGYETGDSLSHGITVVSTAVGYARKPFRMGVQLKAVEETVAGRRWRAGLGDAGLLIEGGNLFAGVSERNLGSASAGGMAAFLPQREWRPGLGAYLQPLNLIVAGEYVIPHGDAPHMEAGLEWRRWRLLQARCGLAAHREDIRVSGGISSGFGKFQLDYAIVTHPLGLTHLVGVSWRLRPSSESASAGPVADRP